jgi:hypothetical protein
LTDDECTPPGPCLTDEERHRLLRRLHSALSWVGIRIPEKATIGGEVMELKDLVDRYVFDDFIDDEERQQVRALIHKIDAQADFLEDVLEERELTREEAEAILRHTIGLLRAIDELEHLEDGEDDRWEDQRSETQGAVEDAQRWNEFTKQVYKKDEYY